MPESWLESDKESMRFPEYYGDDEGEAQPQTS